MRRRVELPLAVILPASHAAGAARGQPVSRSVFGNTTVVSRFPRGALSAPGRPASRAARPRPPMAASTAWRSVAARSRLNLRGTPAHFVP